MKNVVVDANVFLRFILKDILKEYQAAEKLFKKAKNGRVKIIVPQIVILEVAFILGKYYSFPKEVVVEKLESLLSSSYLNIQDRIVFSQSLQRYKQSNLSLTDCFLFHFSQAAQSGLFTFDKDLNKINSGTTGSR